MQGQGLLREHMTVWDADGERVGTVTSLGARVFFISRALRLADYVASRNDVLEVRDDDCFLHVKRSSLRRALLPGDEVNGFRELEPAGSELPRTS